MSYPQGEELRRKRVLSVVAFGALLLLFYALYLIFRPFFVPLCWAAIFVLSTWPLYRKLESAVRGRRTLSALLMTLAVALILAAAVAPLLVSLGREVTAAGDYFKVVVAEEGRPLVAAVEKIPVVGEKLSQALTDEGVVSKQELVRVWGVYQNHIVQLLSVAAKGVLTWFLKVGIFLLSIFFLYLYGSSFGVQLEKTFAAVGGERAHHLVDTVRATLKGTVYGMLATALAQGVLAGLGYAVAGSTIPVVLGFITMVMSFIPFGAPLVYVPVAIALVVNGESLLAGILLVVWGTCVVSTIDNLLRPLFISQATSMPIILVFFGVIGGLYTFGLLGLFLGPIIIALVQALWIEWIEMVERKEVVGVNK